MVDLMIDFIVTDFAPNSPPLQFDVSKELPENSTKERHLKSSVKLALKLLKTMFFEETAFLSETMDRLHALAESTLSTHFGIDITS